VPRRNLPARHGTTRQQAARQDGSAGSPAGGRGWGEQSQWWRGIEFRMRAVSGGAAGSGRPYRCPGCDQLLTFGIAHVVVWPADDPDAADRRHWHTACWSARDRRTPGVQRTRNAPRYG